MLGMIEFGGVFVLIVMLIALPLSIACFAFWVWMLVSAIQNAGLGDGEKVGWVIAIVILPLVGSLLYFFIGHPKRRSELNR